MLSSLNIAMTLECLVDCHEHLLTTYKGYEEMCLVGSQIFIRTT